MLKKINIKILALIISKVILYKMIIKLIQKLKEVKMKAVNMLILTVTWTKIEKDHQDIII